MARQKCARGSLRGHVEDGRYFILSKDDFEVLELEDHNGRNMVPFIETMNVVPGGPNRMLWFAFAFDFGFMYRSAKVALDLQPSFLQHGWWHGLSEVGWRIKFKLKPETLQQLAVYVDQQMEKGSLFGVRDIPEGVPTDEEDEYDYSAILTPEQRADGYELTVDEKAMGDDYSLTVYLVKLSGNAAPVVGRILGSKRGQSVIAEDVRLQMEHRGRGLGKAMYEALYRHGFELGATRVSGSEHSADAHWVHEALASKHGWNYNAYEYGDEQEGTYSPYGYALRGASLGAVKQQSISPTYSYITFDKVKVAPTDSRRWWNARTVNKKLTFTISHQDGLWKTSTFCIEELCWFLSAPLLNMLVKLAVGESVSLVNNSKLYTLKPEDRMPYLVWLKQVIEQGIWSRGEPVLSQEQVSRFLVWADSVLEKQSFGGLGAQKKSIVARNQDGGPVIPVGRKTPSRFPVVKELSYGMYITELPKVDRLRQDQHRYQLTHHSGARFRSSDSIEALEDFFIGIIEGYPAMKQFFIDWQTPPDDGYTFDYTQRMKSAAGNTLTASGARSYLMQREDLKGVK